MTVRALALGFLVLLSLPVVPQTVVGTFTRAGLQPRHVAVYEAGNKIFVADQATSKVYMFSGATHEELSSVTVGLHVSEMAVHQTSGKLYVAEDETDHIVVIDATDGTLIGNLSGTYGNTVEFAVDETRGLVWAHSGLEGLFRIEVASSSVTQVAGIPNAQYRGIALNPSTGEVFVSVYGGALYVVDTAGTIAETYAGKGGPGCGVNSVANKGVVSKGTAGTGAESYVIYDRASETFTPLLNVNDATEFTFDATRNVLITGSEVNGYSTFVRGDDTWFNMPIESASSQMQLRNATGHLYFASSDQITMLDQESQVAVRIPKIGGPTSGVLYEDIAMNHATGRVYVVHDQTVPDITVLQDTDTVVRGPIFVGSSSFSSTIALVDPVTLELVHIHDTSRGELALRPGGGRLYAARSFVGSGTIDVLAGTGNRAEIDAFESVGQSIGPLLVSADGAKLYVVNQPSFGNGQVIVLDAVTGATITSVTVGSAPAGLALAPGGASLYVANTGSDSVSVVNTSTNAVTGTIPVGDGPQQVAVHPAGHKAYVSNGTAGTVSVLDLDAGVVIDTVTAGTTPSWLELTADGKNVYVSNGGSGNVTVIDSGTDEVVTTIPVPGGSGTPKGVGFDPQNGRMFVVGSNPSSASNVIVIDTGSFAATAHALGSGSVGAYSIAVTDVTARIAGRVSSSSSGIVADATVRALQSGVEKGATTTNASGDYAIPTLAPGTYDLEVSATGYQSQTVTGLVGVRGRVTVQSVTLAQCLASLTPSSASIGAAGAAQAVSVTMPSRCAWTAVSNDGFLTITSGTETGNGSGSFGYSASANPTGDQRVGTISVGGAEFTVTQAAAPCVFDVTPHWATYGGGTANGSVNVSVIPGCEWTASAAQGSFATITSGTSGSGSGTVQYDVGSNPGPAARTTTLTVAGVSVEIAQSVAEVITLNAVGGASSVSLSWTPVSGATSFDVLRSSGGGGFASVANTPSTATVDSTVTAGTAYLYRIQANGPSGVLSWSPVELAVVHAYSDTLTANTTPVRAVHFTQLRSAVTAAAITAGRVAPSFTNPSLSSVAIKRVHLVELRDTITAIYATLGKPAPSYTDPVITSQSTRVRATHVTQLRGLLE